MTYASFWIRACMVKYIAASWGGGKTGIGITRVKTLFKLRRENSRLASQQVFADDANRSCCQAFRISPKALRSLLDIMSLQELPLDAGWGEVISSAHDPASEVESAQVHEFCSRAIAETFGVLNQREMLVVSERYLNDVPSTFASLGSRLGITRERVRQIEKSALRKLRSVIGRSGLSREAFREAVL
jgi:RNA polymerase sigma-32 factor